MARLIQIEIPATVTLFVNAKNAASEAKIRKAVKRELRRMADSREVVAVREFPEPFRSIQETALDAGATGWGAPDSAILFVDGEKARELMDTDEKES